MENLELNRYLYDVGVNINEESGRNDKMFSGYSISELRNIDLVAVKRVTEFYCNEVGKTGYYKYDALDAVTVDDCGYCLVTTKGLRLKRNVSDRVLYTWFEEYQGLTDHTGILDKAVKVSKLLKKPLFLKENSTIIVNKSYQVYQSIIGNNSIIKLIDNSTLNLESSILNVKDNNVRLEGFTLDGNRINNRGLFNKGIKGIYADRCKSISFNNISVVSTRDIGVFVSNCPKFSFTNSFVDDCGRYGEDMISAQADRIGCLIDNHVANDNEFYMSSDCNIENVSFTNCGLDGLVLGVAVSLKKCTLNYNGKEFGINDVGAGGVYVRPPQQVENAVIDGLRIIDCVAVGNSGLGIDVGNNAGSALNPKVTNLVVSGNICYDNYLNGIGVASAENFVITKNICYNNGVRDLLNNLTPNLRRSGILIACVNPFPFKNGMVESNVCYDSRAIKTQQNGLMFWGNPKLFGSENIVVQNNDFSRNAGKAILFESNSPVVENSFLTVQNNQGVNSFTVVPTNNTKVAPVSSHIYVNPASAINLIGIDQSTLGNTITLENVSVFDITLVNSASFKMLGNENLVLKQNKPVTFILQYETGAFVWKQLANKSSDVFYNGQIVLQNQGVITYPTSSRFTVNSTYQGSLATPRMTKAQRLAIVMPAVGLKAYQLTETGIEAEEGEYQYKSSGWVKIS
ncbi:hypothetical protein [Arcicella lustrica]|uniref:Right handed beta helix domain-containing protein n=1 Tax=Arcicella lustrica TaxID=2984196 RepID=A0ABU5SHN0_9BACT|nr:hypothetical protein [Arcicella sp. DC25W]MEA5426800.1 hypothetical protein [Arcicella sp. DC25W]